MVRIHKKKSRRMDLKLKYNIDKRVKEHNRRLKKAAKSAPIRRKYRKDPGIPNMWPFKQELLEEIAAAKARKAEEKAAARAKRIAERAAEKEAAAETVE